MSFYFCFIDGTAYILHLMYVLCRPVMSMCVVNILPEVGVEACAKTDYHEGTYDVKPAPAFTDRLLEVGSEGDGLYLCLTWSRSEAAHYYHKYNKEHEQPALENEPVGLPEPCSGIPESTIHC